MATILNLKKSIKTIENVSKTTRAMQMIAASKLKRAQDATLSSRPYVSELTNLSQNLSSKLKEDTHPLYMKKNDNPNTLLIIISPDKGLCGGLISNLFREALNIQEKTYNITVGKKASQYFSRKPDLTASFDFGSSLPSFDFIFPVIEIIDGYFKNEKVGNVKVLYTDFESLFSQKPAVKTLLPISLPEEKSDQEVSFELFEPSIGEILPDLLKHYLEMSLYQYLLEAYLSEQASRMIAMQNATENAKEIISELSLEYNKARQDKITKEILDISNASFNFIYE